MFSIRKNSSKWRKNKTKINYENWEDIVKYPEHKNKSKELLHEEDLDKNIQLIEIKKLSKTIKSFQPTKITKNEINYKINVLGPHADEKIIFSFEFDNLKEITLYSFINSIYINILEQSKHSATVAWLWVKSVRRSFPSFTPYNPNAEMSKPFTNKFIPGSQKYIEKENTITNNLTNTLNDMEDLDYINKDIEKDYVSFFRKKGVTKKKKSIGAFLKCVFFERWLSIFTLTFLSLAIPIWILNSSNLQPWVWGIMGTGIFLTIGWVIEYLIIYLTVVPVLIKTRFYINSLLLDNKIAMYRYLFDINLSIDEYMQNGKQRDRELIRAYSIIISNKWINGLCNVISSSGWDKYQTKSLLIFCFLAWGH